MTPDETPLEVPDDLYTRLQAIQRTYAVQSAGFVSDVYRAIEEAGYTQLTPEELSARNDRRVEKLSNRLVEPLPHIDVDNEQ